MKKQTKKRNLFGAIPILYIHYIIVVRVHGWALATSMSVRPTDALNSWGVLVLGLRINVVYMRLAREKGLEKKKNINKKIANVR